MNYSADEFSDLTIAIENSGGMLLDDPCVSESVEFKNPPYKKKSHIEKRATCGCNNRSRFAIPFSSENEKMSVVTLCAVCDEIGKFPNFAGVVDYE